MSTSQYGDADIYSGGHLFVKNKRRTKNNGYMYSNIRSYGISRQHYPRSIISTVRNGLIAAVNGEKLGPVLAIFH
jgi:hypothetical protein